MKFMIMNLTFLDFTYPASYMGSLQLSEVCTSGSHSRRNHFVEAFVNMRVSTQR